MPEQPERVPPAHVPVPDGDRYPVQLPAAPWRVRAAVFACAVVVLVVMALRLAGLL